MPRNEDELELREGDVVDVMEKCDDGWFVGKMNRHQPTKVIEIEIQNALSQTHDELKVSLSLYKCIKW